MLFLTGAAPRFTRIAPLVSAKKPIVGRAFTLKVGLNPRSTRATVFEFSSMWRYFTSTTLLDPGNQFHTTVATFESPSVSVAVSGVSFLPTPHSVQLFGRYRKLAFRNILLFGCTVALAKISFWRSFWSGTAPRSLVRSVVFWLTNMPDAYQNARFRTIGPPMLNAPTYRSIVLLMPARVLATNCRGRISKRVEPRTWFVPDLLTAFVTNPTARPNSAVMAPRLTLNSAMSRSLTSVLRYPKPGFVMSTPSIRYLLSWRLPPPLGAKLLFSATPGMSWKR